MTCNHDLPPAGKRWVFRPWYTDRNGRRVYPKNAKFFRFLVDDDKE